jgi:hypothetical protein
MASQLFEAPSHEAHYSSPEGYSSPEAHYSSPEAHYSSPEAHYSSPEGYSSPEAHYSSPEAHYSSPEAHEFETEFESHYSSPEAHYSSPEAHYSSPEAHYSSPEAHEFETEFESHYSSPESHEFEFEAHEMYSSPETEFEGEFEYEGELEGEYFFGGLKKLVSRVGRVVAPLAKRFAPMLAKAAAGFIPGVGPLLAPIAGQLVGQLVKEAEGEAEAMQAEFFGAGEGEFEVANTESAHESALAEVLAAQAAESANEAEAESMIAASLPLTITITGGRRATRRVMPALVQANRRLVRAMRKQAGPDGRQLTRVIPKINATTSIALRNMHRRGRPITTPLATKVMAAAARRVLANAPAVARAVARNLMVRNVTAPTHRHLAGIVRCPGCVGRARVAAVARTVVPAAAAAMRPGFAHRRRAI